MIERLRTLSPVFLRFLGFSGLYVVEFARALQRAKELRVSPLQSC